MQGFNHHQMYAAWNFFRRGIKVEFPLNKWLDKLFG
jgi:hypothetical protein